MIGAAATLFFFGMLSLAFVGTAIFQAYRLTPEDRRSRLVRWLVPWSLKGMLMPLTIWTLMNVGLSWNLQPFMPQIQAAQASGGPWIPELLGIVGVGLYIVSSNWAATTVGWILISARLAMEPEQRKDFRVLCLTWGIGLSIPALIILLLGGWTVFGFVACGVLVPISIYTLPLLQPKKVPPMYARAIARMKFGKYDEAEMEIIQELERSDDEFDGWMMLAELYANHFNDVGEAQRTILEICDQPKVTPSQLSVALHRLADWQLKLRQDPVAARGSLQLICQRLPGSHLAHMAQLRINQLPDTADELREQQASKPIPLPVLGDHLDDALPAPQTKLDIQKASQMANACVQKLRQDPNNVVAREKLAHLFVERLDKPELGIEQVMLLFGMPGQPDSKRAEWLGLAAAWHLKNRHDLTTGHALLKQLVEEFPNNPQIFAARRRLQLVEAEMRKETEETE